MAWEATYLLAPVLLVLRVSDSQEQETAPVLLQKLEGETISLICWYQFQKDSNKLKIWCKKMSENSCIPLVTSSRSQVQKSRYSIQDERSSGYFIINMTGLRTADSGFYYCGNYNSFSSVVHILRSFHLVVSQGNVVILRVLPPKTGLEVGSLGLWSKQMGVLPSLLSLLQLQPRSPQGALSSFPSPPGNWKFILLGVVVAVLLLLVLTVFMILYLRKAQGGAGKGEDESHHVCDDLSAQKEKTTGFDQRKDSDEDTGNIHYASLIHLNHFGAEDSIYVNTHSSWRPMPDPLLFVEYVSIARNNPQPSKSTPLERRESQELRADFTG
ncbi:trem-like transcript 4 protein isoform 1-T1 [Trichechus inunguis]